MARRVLRAALVAGVLSGIPSTVITLAKGDDPLESTVAVGSALLPEEEDLATLVGAGLLAHFAISLGWTIAFAIIMRKNPTWIRGGLLGGLVGTIDLELASLRFPQIAALPKVPQLLDHIAFGALVGGVLLPREDPAPLPPHAEV